MRLVVLLVLVLVVAFPSGSSAARAEDGLDRSCSTSLAGTLPVVFVHGWRSNRHAWDAAAAKVLSPSVTTFQFDYEKQNTRWVQDPRIAPALADLVLCLGRNSELSGGPGKVVLVGHSMGGLAIRCALQESCSEVGGVEAYVAQVITIGTPTHGSFLRYGGTIGNAARMALDVVCETVRSAVRRDATRSATDQQNLCQALLTNEAAVAFNDTSTELKALRADSTATPVLALAGDIKLDVGLLFAQFTVAHGDAVVDQRSQHSWGDETADVDCGRLVLGATITAFGYTLTGEAERTEYKCWHGSETANTDAIRLIRDKVNAVNAELPRPDRGKSVRFDGIGDLSLSMTAADLQSLGFVNQGNLYEGMDAACVSYAKSGFPLTASVETATGRVLAINNFQGDPDLRTLVGNITVGSTLGQVRAAFERPGFQVVEKLDLDFGQGSNGVVVNGPGGSIGLALEDASPAAYADGRARIDYLAGVGLPGHAPTLREDGC